MVKQGLQCCLAAALLLAAGCASQTAELSKTESAPAPKPTPTPDAKPTPKINLAFASARLHVPTYLAKHGGRYLIVSCWQHRILFNDDLGEAVSQWQTVEDEQLSGPHSLAFGGGLMVADSAGNHSAHVYRIARSGYQKVQTIGKLGRRPHRTVWDEKTGAFWMLSSNDQSIHKLVPSGDRDAPLQLEYSRKLDFLEGKYTRSMTVWDGRMLFVSGPNKIIVARHADDSFEMMESIPLPSEVPSGMNDLFRTSDGWWYLTATDQSAPKIFRARSLDALKEGDVENVAEALSLPKGAVPYYLSEFDGRIWVPLLYQNGIMSFRHDKGGLPSDIRVLHYFGDATDTDNALKALRPR